MKFGVITEFFDPEPSTITNESMMRKLAGDEHKVHVVTSFPSYPFGRIYPGYRQRLRHVEERDWGSIRRTPQYPSHDDSGIRRFATYASFAASSLLAAPSLREVDALYVYSPPPTAALAGILLKIAKQIPLVLHVQDLWPDSVLNSGMVPAGRQRALSRAITFWCDIVYKQAKSILVLSPGFKNELERRGVPAAKVHVQYNWANEDVFFPIDKSPRLPEQNSSEAPFTVTYAGNLGHAQGLETAVEAARRVQDLPGFRLRLIGTGLEELALRQRAADLRNVSFQAAVPVSEINALHAESDCLLVCLRDTPSYRITIPGKSQVALASRRPIVASVSGDAAQLFKDSGAALVTPSGDVEALSQSFVRMHRMAWSERERMGTAGRAFYERCLSFNSGIAAIRSRLIEAQRD